MAPSVLLPAVDAIRPPPLAPSRRGRRPQPKASWPSAAVEAAYRKRLVKLVDEMARSVVYWVTAARRKREPEVVMAMDDYASTILARALQRLRRLWSRRFDDMARRLAAYFARDVSRRTDEQLKKILRDAGLAVKFELTKAQRDVLGAIVHENVSLIKSIPRKYLDQVEGQVMRSVVAGRDLKQLTDELHETHYASRKYAAFVARDQNNKATGALQRVRFLESNIEECIWMHSGAGKHPRPSHVKAGRDKVRFKVSEGWWDPHEQQYIWPGYLINCRCSCRPVIKGFES